MNFRYFRVSRIAGLLGLLFAVQTQSTLLANEINPSVFGKVIHSGLIDCFEAGLKTEEGQAVYCEASAVVFTSNRVTLASDKPVPGSQYSPVFSFDYIGTGPILGAPVYLTATSFLSAIKYEDMTLTTDGAYVIASTGFDRVRKDTTDWDGYNTMMLWPVGNPDAVTVVAASTTDGVTSSVSLREKISRVLSTKEFPLGAPYFKVEGVAAIPGQQLLIGIRETGVDYRDFSYEARIIAVTYTIAENELTLGDDFRLIYDFDPAVESMIPQQTGLSSIEYDRFHDRLYLLTSYEIDQSDEGMGGYLWVLPMQDFRAGQAPALVLRDDGSPLLFAHKPEAVTILGDNLVLVVHDDDQVLGRDTISNPETQFSKGAHQAAYTVVSIGAGLPENPPVPEAEPLK